MTKRSADTPKRPTSVRVAAYTYEVRYDEAAVSEARALELEPVMGHCNHETLRITVRGDVAEPNVQQILLHEVLHACVWAAGSMVDLATKGDDPEEAAEEAVIRTTAPVLWQVLRDNPGLLRYLLADAVRAQA